MVLFNTISGLLVNWSLFFSLQRQNLRDPDYIYIRRMVISDIANQVFELAMNTMSEDSHSSLTVHVGL